MKRTLIAIIAVVALASTANAATLSLQVAGSPGASVSVVSGPITLELVANIGPGDPITLGALVNVVGTGGISFTGATQVGLTAFGGNLPWTLFPTSCVGVGVCTAVNQGNPVLPTGTAADAFSGVIATITANISGSTVFDVLAIDVGADTFFGVGDQPGALTVNVVPEPTTAALLSLGLVGLVASGRRR